MSEHKWYERYTGFPYKHLGENPETGIDCGNLIRYIWYEEKKIWLPKTSEGCQDQEESWYQTLHKSPFDRFTDFGFTKITEQELAPFDLITLSIGSTNCTNHCAMLVEPDKIIHIMMGHNSFVSPYKPNTYYRRYTVGRYRWIVN